MAIVHFYINNLITYSYGKLVQCPCVHFNNKINCLMTNLPTDNL